MSAAEGCATGSPWEGCYDAPRSNLATGQEIQFFAEAWAKSQPPQATVDDVVIRG